MIDWAAISGIADIIQLVKGVHIFSPRETKALSEETLSIKNERYQSTLGKRHRYVREEILQFHPREMADFYGFEKVAFLEDCENGIDEFPTKSINKLIKTFSIRAEYFQDNQYPIFDGFDIISSSDDCKYYLEKGFQPYFFCSPIFDDSAMTYLVFIKKEKKYCITIKSSSPISLSGGYNIHRFISAILSFNPNYYNSSILFLTASAEEWKRLERGCWYTKKNIVRMGSANNIAKELFEDMIEGHKKNM